MVSIDLQTSSDVCIAKRKAGIQFHLCLPISRLDFWSEVLSTVNKEGNSSVSGQVNGSRGELLTTEQSYIPKLNLGETNLFLRSGNHIYLPERFRNSLSFLSPHHRNIIPLIQYKITFNEKC